METQGMNSDEVNLWKCLVLLESESDKSDEMMYDMLCESIVKQKGVSSVAVLKNLEKATGKPATIFKTVGQESPVIISSDSEEDDLKWDSATPPYSPIQTHQPPSPAPKWVWDSESTKKSHPEPPPSQVLSEHGPGGFKVMKMQQRFKELFDD